MDSDHNPTPEVLAADTTPKGVSSRLKRRIEAAAEREKAREARMAEAGGAGRKHP